ncbi:MULTISPECIES: hypothetical protein [Pseudomonas]|uniref:Uncharacterized protein n=1 Tax=Pseudomonas monachiensis TaxID=3060212 RepID=A0ABW9H1U2_9PSED|nr:hypothetical protein [Pseudomonas sp. BF-RE-26]
MHTSIPVGAAAGCDLFKAPTKQGISGRFDGLFFCLEETGLYISFMHNQMNKYDLWIYESAVKVTPSKRDRKPRIANTVQGIV